MSRYVRETLAEVYKNDALARKDALCPQQRLVSHQLHSAPLMNDLHAWMKNQIDDKLVEPNSGLGQAIAYMTNHWEFSAGGTCPQAGLARARVSR